MQNRTRRLLNIAVGAAAIAIPSFASAAVLINDTFTYSDGAIVTVSSNAWIQNSGSGTYNVVSNRLLSTDNDATFPTGGAADTADFYRAFTQQAKTDTTYASFTLNVTSGDLPTITVASSAPYFAHFMASTTSGAVSTSTFVAKTFLMGGTTAGTFKLGLSSNSNTVQSSIDNLAADTDYKVVLSFNGTTHVATLDLYTTSNILLAAGISGEDFAGYTVSSIAGLAGFQFRTSGASDGDKFIDNLLVGSSYTDVVPEPSSLSAAGASSLLVLLKRRKRA